MIYSAEEACDVGADTGSPASPDYGPTGNKFSGQIDWVQIDIGDDSHDHLIKPEDRLTVARHGNNGAALGDSGVTGMAGSVEELQFEFHRLVIHAGQSPKD
jgi:hypothetical protein